MTARASRKVSFSEEDVSSVLQRYNPTTILTLLQEVSQVADVKIDWNALVKRTATGIASAREYQMLWRHLAYHHTLLEKIEDGTDPLDDESDLEVETEAVPAASSETLSEAAACVKVLMSSGLPREQGLINRANVEAPSTLNGLNDQTSRVLSDKQHLSRSNRSTNITVPTLQKQPMTTGISAEDGNGSAGTVFPPKKKRKLWTKEEDMELIAAVQKYGEGNWANILKGDFKHDRTASQLSQRWAIIRKRDTNLLAGSGNKTASSTRSEERLATQKAISLALDMPKSGRLSAMLSGGTQSMVTTVSSSALSAAQSEALPVSSQSHNQLPQASTTAASQKISLNTSNKPRTTPKKCLVPVKPSTGPNSLIQAAAFAAGGRIATPSTAASLFKAAQSKNAVHIRPGGGARPSQISNVKQLAAVNTTSQQLTSARFGRPATMVASSLVNPVSVASCTSNGGQQVQGCSGSTANNPLNAASTNQQAILESTISHEMTERKDDLDMTERKDDLDFSAIDVDELLAEEVKCADEIELDDIMAQDDQPGMLNLDTSANEDNDFDNTYDAGATAEKHMVLLKSMVDENMSNEIVFSDVEAAESKDMELDDIMAHEDQPGLQSLDKSTNEDRDFQNAHNADATADKQMDLPTLVVDENTNLDSKMISSNVEAVKSKAVELDGKMTHEDQPVLPSLDKSANRDLHNAHEADATVDKQVDRPESMVDEKTNLDNKIVSCDVDATESKAMELDDIIAHEDQPGLQRLDKSAIEYSDFHNVHDADATLEKRMDLPNSLVDEDKNLDHKIVSSDVEPAKSKAIENGSSGEQISIEKGTALSNSECNEISHGDNNLNDTVQDKAASCIETTVDDHNNLTNDEQVE